MQQPWRTHLSSPEMHAPGARKTRRMHLLAPKDARVQHVARANGGDTRLLLSKSSATGGSTPLRTNAGGSVLPETDLGGFYSLGGRSWGFYLPRNLWTCPVSSTRTFNKEEMQTKKAQVIQDSHSSARSFCIPGA